MPSRPCWANNSAGPTRRPGTTSGGPLVDQRRILDPSFLELVRAGVLPPNDRDVRSTLRLVDATLGYATASGPFWHRSSFDGYGERRSGAPWEPTDPGSRLTIGRGWPQLTGERGEYSLEDAGRQAETPQVVACRYHSPRCAKT